MRYLHLCWLLTLLLVLTTVPALAQEEGPVKVEQPPKAAVPDKAKAWMDQAREAYNNERYKDAIRLYISAAQADPGARALQGTPYRNMARCHYWLGNYDSATFWYDVYLGSWPKASDAEGVQAERKNTNGRRSDPSKPVTAKAIYDRNLLELVDIIRTRLKNNAEAWTNQGGGTASLYALAIKRGYAMPELASWSDTLSRQLIEELRVRWTSAPNSPLPIMGTSAEPLDTSRGRIKALNGLSLDGDQRETANAYRTLISAWQQFLSSNYTQAAEGFAIATNALPTLGYLPYAKALAQLRAGDAPAAVETLQASTPKAPAPLKPYYRILHAEALRTMNKHNDAARIYMELLQAPPSPPKAKTIPPAAPEDAEDTTPPPPPGAPPAKLPEN